VSVSKRRERSSCNCGRRSKRCAGGREGGVSWGGSGGGCWVRGSDAEVLVGMGVGAVEDWMGGVEWDIVEV